MNVDNLAIDIFGVAFDFYLSIVFFSTFWEVKPVKGILWASGLCGIGIISILAATFIKSGYLLPIVFVLTSFLLAHYFKASITSRILFAVILSALLAFSEMLAAVTLILVLHYSAEQVQSSFIAYATGLLSSKLFAFLLIYLVKFIIKSKNREFDKWFNLLLLLLPVQSLALCVVVYGISVVTTDAKVNSLNLIVLFISFSFLVITAFIVKKQSEAIEYKQKYELACARSQAQLEQYNELYTAGQEIRGIKHDMQNTLTAIGGLLSGGKTQDAIDRIEKTQSSIRQTNLPINTGYPTIDAIVSAKTKKASEFGINIKYAFAVGALHIDQFDVALVLANALDNAIEAAAKCPNAERDIRMSISSKSGYISISVENPTNDMAIKNLKTTKPDKASHGFGIKHMKSIARKYDGNLIANFDPEAEKFQLNILLKNREM